MADEESRPRTTKIAYFFPSGAHSNRQPVKVPINKRRYRTVDALLDDLTGKMPELQYGARCLATPKGTHKIKDMEQVQHLNAYVCTDKPHRRIKGVDLDKVQLDASVRANAGGNDNGDEAPRRHRHRQHRADNGDKRPSPRRHHGHHDHNEQESAEKAHGHRRRRHRKSPDAVGDRDDPDLDGSVQHEQSPRREHEARHRAHGRSVEPANSIDGEEDKGASTRRTRSQHHRRSEHKTAAVAMSTTDSGYTRSTGRRHTSTTAAGSTAPQAQSHRRRRHSQRRPTEQSASAYGSDGEQEDDVDLESSTAGSRMSTRYEATAASRSTRRTHTRGTRRSRPATSDSASHEVDVDMTDDSADGSDERRPTRDTRDRHNGTAATAASATTTSGGTRRRRNDKRLSSTKSSRGTMLSFASGAAVGGAVERHPPGDVDVDTGGVHSHRVADTGRDGDAHGDGGGGGVPVQPAVDSGGQAALAVECGPGRRTRVDGADGDTQAADSCERNAHAAMAHNDVTPAEEERRDAAASKIQAGYRGFQARRELKRQNEAAAVIQRNYRMYSKKKYGDASASGSASGSGSGTRQSDSAHTGTTATKGARGTGRTNGSTRTRTRSTAANTATTVERRR